MPADKKPAIETAVGHCKEAHMAQNIDEIDDAIEDIESTFGAAQQDILNATAQAQAGAQQAQPNHGAAQGSHDDGGVTDVDFEEVK